MTFENFFIYSALIEERQLDIGFELYAQATWSGLPQFLPPH
jgi:hypothetical protein